MEMLKSHWNCQTGFQSWEFSRGVLKHKPKLISVKIFRLIQLKFEHVKLWHGVLESKFQSSYSFNILIYLHLFWAGNKAVPPLADGSMYLRSSVKVQPQTWISQLFSTFKRGCQNSDSSFKPNSCLSGQIGHVGLDLHFMTPSSISIS